MSGSEGEAGILQKCRMPFLKELDYRKKENNL